MIDPLKDILKEFEGKDDHSPIDEQHVEFHGTAAEFSEHINKELKEKGYAIYNITYSTLNAQAAKRESSKDTNQRMIDILRESE